MARRAGIPVNARPVIVTDYTPDPHGVGLFERLSAVLQLGISGHTGQVQIGDKGSPERSFMGDLGRNVQTLVGAAPLALYGAAKPVHDATGTIGGTVSADALNDGALRIFAARARRQAGGFPA